MGAKVTPPLGISFYVKSGEDIHNVPQYETLPLEDKNFLALNSINGMYRGLVLTSDFRDSIVVTHDSVRLPPPVFGAKWEKRDVITLLLPKDTRVEPITRQQMEDELRAQQKPSRREK